MKKRILLLAGILVLGFVIAGCGCGKKDEEEQKEVQTTVAPVEEDGTKEKDLVEMQVSTQEKIENVMGEKTSTASELVLINKTGSEVAAIYIRPNTDDDEWGEELVQGSFVLKDGDKALYYFEKGKSSLYDIRITYSEEGKNECFFRKIPLNNITQITLRMDGVGEDSIPYATYLSGTSKKEVSTLNEVKQRLGYYDNDNDNDDEDYDDEDDYEEDTYVAPTPTPVTVTTPEPTEAPEPDDGSGDGDYEPDPKVTAATGYIGQSLDDLVNSIGQASAKEYVDEPESGQTGYHYYTTENGSFTVSTIVDENGNEIVAGVW